MDAFLPGVGGLPFVVPGLCPGAPGVDVVAVIGSPVGEHLPAEDVQQQLVAGLAVSLRRRAARRCLRFDEGVVGGPLLGRRGPRQHVVPRDVGFQVAVRSHPEVGRIGQAERQFALLRVEFGRFGDLDADGAVGLPGRNLRAEDFVLSGLRRGSLFENADADFPVGAGGPADEFHRDLDHRLGDPFGLLLEGHRGVERAVGIRVSGIFGRFVGRSPREADPSLRHVVACRVVLFAAGRRRRGQQYADQFFHASQQLIVRLTVRVPTVFRNRGRAACRRRRR